MKQQAASATDTIMKGLMLSAAGAVLQLQRAYDTLNDPNATEEQRAKAEAKLSVHGGLASMQALLDRGHGKPQQKVEVSAENPFSEMERGELEQFLITNGAEVMKMLNARKNKG